MNRKVITVKSLQKLIKEVSKIKVDKESFLVFRGESEDFKKTALTPGIYRDNYIENEDKIYREMQRFNDQEFLEDKTTFDKLSRMQHYRAPTRLLDVTEDLLSAVFFALEDKDIDSDKAIKEKKNALIYVFEIKEENVKYYDSDAVSVVSNLVKIPLESTTPKGKSKKDIICDIRDNKIKKFNKKKSAKFLRHEIREEKPQFEAIIDPKHITSVLYVKPKLTNSRIKSQKGSFFLFGLNPEDKTTAIKLFERNGNKYKLIKQTKNLIHPIEKCHIFEIDFNKIQDIKESLEKLGITKPFIYPEMEKVADYLKNKYK